jgi:hypothetical protein
VFAVVAAACLLKRGWFALGGFSLSVAIGLQTLLSDGWSRNTGTMTSYQWDQRRRQILEERYPIFWSLCAALLALTAAVCYAVREPWKLVVAGLLPMFTVFAVSSYYYAVLILLAPLAVRGVLHAAVLFGMILTAHFFYQHAWTELVFLLYSGMVLGVLLYFLAVLFLDRQRAMTAPSSPLRFDRALLAAKAPPAG